MVAAVLSAHPEQIAHPCDLKPESCCYEAFERSEHDVVTVLGLLNYLDPIGCAVQLLQSITATNMNHSSNKHEP